MNTSWKEDEFKAFKEVKKFRERGSCAKLVEKSAGNFKNTISNNRVANLSNRKMKISHLTFGIHFVSNNYLMAKNTVSGKIKGKEVCIHSFLCI